MKNLLLLALLIMTGCATTTTPSAEVRLISDSQIIAPSYFQRSNAKQIEVLIKRDQGLIGSGTGVIFSIEGKPVARLGAGQGARIYLNPGRYLFGVLPTVNLGLSSIVEIEAEVNNSVRQVYRIATVMGTSGVRIARTSE
jgi:hypothetical protein